MKRKMIYHILNELGVSCDLTGRTYIEYALEHLLANGRMSMNNELYPAMAMAFSATKGRIERGIRYSIERMFECCSPNVLDKYFGNTVNYDSGKLTNTQFLYGVVKYIETFGDEIQEGIKNAEN